MGGAQRIVGVQVGETKEGGRREGGRREGGREERGREGGKEVAGPVRVLYRYIYKILYEAKVI